MIFSLAVGLPFNPPTLQDSPSKQCSSLTSSSLSPKQTQSQSCFSVYNLTKAEFSFPWQSLAPEQPGGRDSRVGYTSKVPFRLTGLLRLSSILVDPQSHRGAFSVATGSCSLPHVLPVPLSLDLRPWDGVREAVSLLSG